MPLRSVYKTDWYGGSNFTPIYTYCDDAGFQQYADKCESCLHGKNGTYILGNCEWISPPCIWGDTWMKKVPLTGMYHYFSHRQHGFSLHK